MEHELAEDSIFSPGRHLLRACGLPEDCPDSAEAMQPFVGRFFECAIVEKKLAARSGSVEPRVGFQVDIQRAIRLMPVEFDGKTELVLALAKVNEARAPLNEARRSETRCRNWWSTGSCRWGDSCWCAPPTLAPWASENGAVERFF